MAFTDDIAAASGEIKTTVTGYQSAAATALAALQADDDALAILQNDIANARAVLAQQIAAFTGLVPPPKPAPAP